MTTDKIFIDRESSGNFLMRLPEEAVCDLYEMIVASPLLPRRTFYQVRQHLESQYPEFICRSTAKEDGNG